MMQKQAEDNTTLSVQMVSEGKIKQKQSIMEPFGVVSVDYDPSEGSTLVVGAGCLCIGNSVGKRVREKAEALHKDPSPGEINSFSSLVTFWLVRRPWLLLRCRGAAGGDLLLLCLYGA
jgi:hypothetical protein